ncbi:cytochrome b2 [Colletotrichum graminicola]|nr:cytochrome b2 [Colletotrichum graminicola]
MERNWKKVPNPNREIYRNVPEVSQNVDIVADSGVHYGNYVLKLRVLGFKVVGLSRPFMYAKYYGLWGVIKDINTTKIEILRVIIKWM